MEPQVGQVPDSPVRNDRSIDATEEAGQRGLVPRHQMDVVVDEVKSSQS